MTKNPFLNALASSAYIVLIIIFIQNVLFTSGKEDNILIPIAMLSLFVLSAALMGYLFLSMPVLLYLDGNKKEAVSLFLKTTAVFAGITAIIITALLWI